jgi:hypothetical protein
VTAFLVYAGLALAFTWPLATHLDSGILRGEDTEDALQQTWVLAWVRHAVVHLHWRLFDAPIFYPAHDTLAFHDTMLPLALFTLPLGVVVHNPLVIYNVMVLLSYPLCGIAMYALAQHVTGDTRAATLAGMIFAFCPYRERHLEHLNLLSAEAIPLLILAVELARARGGLLWWSFLGAMCVIATLLSLYYAAFTFLAVGLYIGVLALRRTWIIAPQARRGMWILGSAMLLELGALAPYLTASHAAVGRNLDAMVYFSADVRDYLHAGPQSLLYGWSDRLWQIPPLDVRQYLFPGVTAILLAALPLWRPKNGPHRGAGRIEALDRARTYTIVAAALAICTLGPYLRLFGTFTGLPLPYLAIYAWVPGFAGLRDVARYDQVLMAFVAATAAIGAARLFQLRPLWANRIFLALACAISVEYATVQRPLYPVASGAKLPAVYQWLGSQPPGAVLELPICGLPGPPCLEESTYMYYSAYHWHPLVNGGGGFFPPAWLAQTNVLNGFPSRIACTRIRALGVRYIIIHQDFPDLARVARLTQTGSAAAPYCAGATVYHGADRVYELDATSGVASAAAGTQGQRP